MSPALTALLSFTFWKIKADESQGESFQRDVDGRDSHVAGCTEFFFFSIKADTHVCVASGRKIDAVPSQSSCNDCPKDRHPLGVLRRILIIIVYALVGIYCAPPKKKTRRTLPVLKFPQGHMTSSRLLTQMCSWFTAPLSTACTNHSILSGNGQSGDQHEGKPAYFKHLIPKT